MTMTTQHSLYLDILMHDAIYDRDQIMIATACYPFVSHNHLNLLPHGMARPPSILAVLRPSVRLHRQTTIRRTAHSSAPCTSCKLGSHLFLCVFQLRQHADRIRMQFLIVSLFVYRLQWRLDFRRDGRFECRSGGRREKTRSFRE